MSNLDGFQQKALDKALPRELQIALLSGNNSQREECMRRAAVDPGYVACDRYRLLHALTGHRKVSEFLEHPSRQR